MSKKRVLTLVILFILLLIAVLLKLGLVSLIKGEALSARAESQQTRTVCYYQYDRGDICDRNGQNLTNVKESALVIFLTMVEDDAQTAEKISRLFNLPPEKTAYFINCARNEGRKTLILKTGLSKSDCNKFNELPIGAYILPLYARYAATGTAVHLIGSVVRSQDGLFHGTAGLELLYDQYLQNRGGPKIAALADEKGRLITESGFRLIGGHQEKNFRLLLTIDKEYQEILEKALAPFSGAAVLMCPQTGEILACASSPSYDPYYWNNSDRQQVFFNKAFGQYPPASVFKVLLTAAALEEKLPLKEDFFCSGSYLLSNGHAVHCHKRTGHGIEDLQTALANSCNPYFLDLALRLGGKTLKSYANKFSLTEQKVLGYSAAKGSSIDFNSAVDADIANVAIGEKGVSLSPVQVAQLLSVIANGGMSVTPRLVLNFSNNDGEIISSFSQESSQRVISSETANKVRELLFYAANEGTGKNAAATTVAIGGKTGTSQNKGVWFAGFAPAENPRWVLAVYIDNGSAGGKEGAAVFAETISKVVDLSGI